MIIYELARIPNLIFSNNMKFYISCISLLPLLLFFISCNSSSKITNIDFHDGSYVGEVDEKGLKHGKGSYKWLDGSFYEGDFEKDFRHGIGHFRWANGESYKGDYLQDQRTGQGIYTWSDGSFYEGGFLNGKRHGTGVFIAAEGLKYEGEWFDDLLHGKGARVDQDGGIIRGIWQNGKLLTKPMSLPEPTTKPNISLETSFVNPFPEEQKSDSESKRLSADTDNKTENQGSISDFRRNEAPENNPSEIELIPNDKPSVDEDSSPSTVNQNIWTGTVDEVEINFVNKLVDGVDTIFDRRSNSEYTGKMRILDNTGRINGELELLDGRMNGEELYFENGNLIEKNLWENGKFIKSLPLD